MNPRLLAAVVLCAAGCAVRAPAVAPVASPEPGAPFGLRVSGKGRIDLAREHFRFDAALALRAPDRLHVEIFGPVGGTRAVLAMRGNQVIVLLPSDRIVIEGPPTRELFDALLGLRLDGPSLVRLLGTLGDTQEGTLPRTRVEGGLRVTREASRLVAEADPPDPDGFQRLELRVHELERVPANDLPDSLFSPTPPSGWRRLDPDHLPPGGPLLLP